MECYCHGGDLKTITFNGLDCSSVLKPDEEELEEYKLVKEKNPETQLKRRGRVINLDSKLDFASKDLTYEKSILLLQPLLALPKISTIISTVVKMNLRSKLTHGKLRTRG